MLSFAPVPSLQPTATADRNGTVAAVDQLEGAGRLRLDCNDARTQPPERGDAIADMGADVEHQIVRPHELAIEMVHGGALPAVAVIDT
jgi:hypothetical protein